MSNESKSKDVARAEEPKAPVLAGRTGLQLRDLEQMYRFGQYVATSGFAPKGMDSAAACLIAVQMGAEIGLAPMQSIQSIAVINGRPSVWGDAVKAICVGSGVCQDFGEWFEGNPYDDDFTAICEIKRSDMSRPVRHEFSVADAKRAGLWQTKETVQRTGKGGGKYETLNDSPWYRYPKRMLQMRARGFACRDAFPDYLRGIRIAEEVQDMQAIDVQASETSRPASLDDVAEVLEKSAEPVRESTQEDDMGRDPVYAEDAEEVVDPETGEVTEPKNPNASGDLF